jgi:hypothetical protein
MESITVEADGMTVEITLERLYDVVGNELILNSEDPDNFGYLAALALECYHKGDYTFVRMFDEFSGVLSDEQREELIEVLER